jgi:hypothetical protein
MVQNVFSIMDLPMYQFLVPILTRNEYYWTPNRLRVKQAAPGNYPARCFAQPLYFAISRIPSEQTTRLDVLGSRLLRRFAVIQRAETNTGRFLWYMPKRLASRRIPLLFAPLRPCVRFFRSSCSYLRTNASEDPASCRHAGPQSPYSEAAGTTGDGLDLDRRDSRLGCDIAPRKSLAFHGLA